MIVRNSHFGNVHVFSQFYNCHLVDWASLPSPCTACMRSMECPEFEKVFCNYQMPICWVILALAGSNILFQWTVMSGALGANHSEVWPPAEHRFSGLQLVLIFGIRESRKEVGHGTLVLAPRHDFQFHTKAYTMCKGRCVDRGVS